MTSSDLEPPIKGMMVWGHNPLVNQIDAEAVRQGLCRDDLFTVVIEHFMTDTARHSVVPHRCHQSARNPHFPH
ncbi:hypothetical protein [Ovoidimarina sediminis]|uniref:hypothetical protein n=1 Tax=Ovoidimarina sediminis TaxID=3079856 RepID=UPI00292E563C|nr:hypothetical protein [Rhodophyticola sp. MJ-SS7]